MVTKEQALTADTFHENGCTRSIGPRGGEQVHIRVYRRNGQTRTWVTKPDLFLVPIKHGLYTYGRITEVNAPHFHTSTDCPLTREQL